MKSAQVGYSEHLDCFVEYFVRLDLVVVPEDLAEAVVAAAAAAAAELAFLVPLALDPFEASTEGAIIQK